MKRQLLQSSLCMLTAGTLTGCFTSTVERNNDSEARRMISRTHEVTQTLPSTPQTRGTMPYANSKAREQQQPELFKKARTHWVGGTYVPVNAEDRLPAKFHDHFVLRFADEGGVSIATVAARLTELVRIPVRIQPDVFQVVDDTTGPTKSARQISGSLAYAGQLTPENIQMNWDGTLIDFLNHLTDRLGLSWEYRDGNIVLMRFVTEAYEIATFPNAYDYSLNSGAGGKSAGENMSANASLSVNEKGKMDGLKSFLAVLEKLVGEVPGSEVIQAEGSGRILVKTSKSVQTKVRELVRAENAAMLKQVHIQLDIYSVTVNQKEQQGLDWTLFYQQLTGNPNTGISPATLVDTTTSGNIAFKVNSEKFAGSGVIIQALSEMGSNVQHRPISLVAMNRQWARKARLSSQGYLSETTPGTTTTPGAASGLPGLTTDTITTGDQFSAMPFVLENNTVLLKMGVSLSTLESLFDVTTGTGATLQRVQTPNTNQINDQYTIALKPGEIMAITGLSRESLSNNDRSLGESIPFFFGGSKKSETKREHFVIFVRAVLI